MTKIREFIKNNEISFDKGMRNSSVTTLIGFAQHLRLSKDGLKDELDDEIENDSFIEEEIDRLYTYCERNNYKDFWSTKASVKQYKF